MKENKKRIDELKEKIEEMQNEIFELEKQNYGYFIGKSVYAHCCDYGDCEFYLPLGYITIEDAAKWKKNMNKQTDIYRADYFAVSKEIYIRYCKWCDLEQIRKSINSFLVESDITGYENDFQSFREILDECIKNVKNEIGINLTFQYPDI